MWSIFWLVIAFLALIVWVFLLVLDYKLYNEYLKRQARRQEAIKRAKKKRIREFKWPENLPHLDL